MILAQVISHKNSNSIQAVTGDPAQLVIDEETIAMFHNGLRFKWVPVPAGNPIGRFTCAVRYKPFKQYTAVSMNKYINVTMLA